MKFSPASHVPWVMALAAVLSHQAAHGQAYTSATIGNYQYTLTDLDLNDGIAPSITWEQSLVTQKMYASLSDGMAQGGSPNATVGTRTEDTYTVPIGTPESKTFEGFQISSGPNGMTASASMPVGGQWWLQSSVSNGFVLSAKTAVTFTAQADVAYGVVVPSWSVVQRQGGYMDNGYFDWAPLDSSAETMLHIGGTADFSSEPPGCKGCTAVDSIPLYVRTYATANKSASKLLSVSFANDTQGAQGSNLALETYTSGYATAPLMMVPELSASTQMLLGLAGLGAVSRLRHRRVTG